MSVSPHLVAAPATVAAPTSRIASIDVFRGLTIMVMIFVNDLSGVRGLPWWTYHAHMTRRHDLCGHGVPLLPLHRWHVDADRNRGSAQAQPILRCPLEAYSLASLGLVVLGLILANAEKGDPVRMGISTAAWALLRTGGRHPILARPNRNTRHPRIFLGLRIVGFLMIIGVFAVFRRTTHGAAAWIDFSYPEILGLIGFAYFSVALLYVSTRRWLWAPLAWFVALTAFCTLNTAHIIQLPRHLPLYYLALRRGRFIFYHHGWSRNVNHLSWQASLAKSPPKNVDGARLCDRHADCGMDPGSAWHFKNSRNSHLVPG